MSEYEKIIDKYDPNKFIQETDDFIIAKGGDGTLLRAIAKFKRKGKPFLGVAAGSANFMMNDYGKMMSYYKPYSKAKYKKLKLLKVEISPNLNNSEKNSKTFYAFNEVSIGSFNGWVEFDCKHKDDLIGKVKGAGIVISTAQGTTGLNKNNNGTILPLSSKNWSVTGTQLTRNVNYILEPKPIKILTKSRKPIQIMIDGHEKVLLEGEDKEHIVKITQGLEVVVIFNNYKEFKKKRR